MKIAVIGAGAVGSTTAYTIVVKNLSAEVILIDINEDKEKGEVLDIGDAISFTETGKIKTGNYEDAKDADIIILTAGLAQKSGETRLNLVKKNKEIVSSIFKQIGQIKPTSIILVISNPVDVITYLIQEIAGLPINQVFGTGTSLDTARLRSNLAKRFGVDASQIEGYVLGEHGDSEFVAWSTVNIAGKKAEELLNKEEMDKIADEVKNEVYEIIKDKGATFYGIAMVATDIVEAIILNQNKILPVSYRLNNCHGVDGICLGYPAIIGTSGIVKPWEINLNDEEKLKLQKSAETLKQYI